MNPLYLAYESFHAAMALPRAAAATVQRALDAVASMPGYDHGLKGAQAGVEMFERMTRRYAKPRFGIESTTVDGLIVDVEESVVREFPFMRLLRIGQKGFDPRRPRLILVAPMSGHHATLVRSTVKAYLPTHDVFVTDWADASEVPLSAGRFGLDDYIDYLTVAMHEFSGPDLSVMAICQPSVPLLAAVALMEQFGAVEMPKAMVLIGGPIDTRKSPTEVNKFAMSRGTEWFRNNMISTVPWNRPGAGRRVYPGFLQLTAFMSMNAERHAKAHIDMFKELSSGDEASAARRKDFYDEYLAVADLTEEFYIETVDKVFVRHNLPEGRFTYRGTRVDPGAIRRVALMTIEGENDDITGIGQTQAAHDLCSNLRPEMKRHLMQPGVGHYGLFSGSKFRTEIVPQVLDFLKG